MFNKVQLKIQWYIYKVLFLPEVFSILRMNQIPLPQESPMAGSSEHCDGLPGSTR